MDKYDVIRHLGQGAFGEVTECIERASGDRVAVKVISNRRYETWDECLKLREVRALRQLGSKHTNIVVLRQIVRENKKLYLVFDYHPINLHQRLKEVRQAGRFVTLDVIARWAYQLVSALAYMHRYGFFHRDIKPENLLMDFHDGIQVCDFGLARDVRSRPPFTSYVSTKWYRAPELVLRASVYNSPVDIWAAACVIAECLTLTPLFPAQDRLEHMLRITSCIGPITSKSWPQGSTMLLQQHLQLPSSRATKPLAPSLIAEYEGLGGDGRSDSLQSCVNLITDMLQLDPHARPSAAHCMNHSFLRDCHEQMDTLRDGLQHNSEPANFKVDTPTTPRDKPVYATNGSNEEDCNEEDVSDNKLTTPLKSFSTGLRQQQFSSRDSELRILTQEIDELTREVQGISTSPDGQDSNGLLSNSILDTSKMESFQASDDDDEESSCEDIDSGHDELPASPLKSFNGPPRVPPFQRTSSLERRRVVTAYLDTLDDDDDSSGSDYDNNNGNDNDDSESSGSECLQKRLPPPKLEVNETLNENVSPSCEQTRNRTGNNYDAAVHDDHQGIDAQERLEGDSFLSTELQSPAEDDKILVGPMSPIQDTIEAEEIPVETSSAWEELSHDVHASVSEIAQDAIEICSIGSDFSSTNEDRISDQRVESKSSFSSTNGTSFDSPSHTSHGCSNKRCRQIVEQLKKQIYEKDALIARLQSHLSSFSSD